MEIKCKVSFSLPTELMEAFEVGEGTPIRAYVKGDRIVVVIAECYHDEDAGYYDDDEDEDDDFVECDCGCNNCEHFCHQCGRCVLDD